MAKEPDDALDEPIEEDQSNEKKSGDFFLLNNIVKILVYVLGVLIAFIVMITVAVITYRIMDSQNNTQNISTIEEQFSTTNKIYSYYDQIPQIRTQTANSLNNASTVTVSIQLGYDGDEYPRLTEELTRRNPQLTDMFRSYFSQRSSEDLSNSNEERIKLELRNAINELLQTGQIEEVVFPEYQVFNGLR